MDFIFGFTTHHDRNAFQMLEDLQGTKYKSFVLEDIYPLDAEANNHFNTRNAWINVKKLVGLSYIHQNFCYDYIIVCDAEIKLLSKPFDHVALIKEVCDRADILGTTIHGTSQIIQNINHACISVLPAPWKEKLLTLTKQCTFLAWFSNVPVYEKKYLTEFFEALGPSYVTNLSYHSFDHVIYYLFLVYKGYWNIKQIEDYGHSAGLECTNNPRVYIDLSKHFLLLWVNCKIYNQITNYIESSDDKAFIVFHRDRL